MIAVVAREYRIGLVCLVQRCQEVSGAETECTFQVELLEPD